MNKQWVEIIGIWVLVTLATTLLMLTFKPGQDVLAEFGAVLAGSIATVSIIQLFSGSHDGFVRRLIYVAGGSFLILAAATTVFFLRG